jgi:hypothetical protein
MDSARSERLWRAIRIVTFAVMGAVVFARALVLTTQVWNEFDVAIVGRDTVSWTDSESFDAPIGAVMLSNGGEEWMTDYIPLLGYVWWVGPLGFALLLAAGLGIVYYSRHPLVPGSYLAPTTAAVGVAIALFGVASAPTFVCVMYDDWAGCYLHWFNFVPLILGSLLLGFAVLFPHSLLLGAAAGGLLGLFIGSIALFPTANANGLWWLPLVTTVVGAVSGVVLSAAARRWRPDERPTSGWRWVLFAAMVVVAFLPVGLALAGRPDLGTMVIGVLGVASSLLLVGLVRWRLTWPRAGNGLTSQ